MLVVQLHKDGMYGDLFHNDSIEWLPQPVEIDGHYRYGITKDSKYWIGENIPRYLPKETIIYTKLFEV